MMYPVLVLLSFIPQLLAQANCSALPTVDLGYEIHQAISFNVGQCPLTLSPTRTDAPRLQLKSNISCKFIGNGPVLHLFKYPIWAGTGW